MFGFVTVMIGCHFSIEKNNNKKHEQKRREEERIDVTGRDWLDEKTNGRDQLLQRIS